MKITDEQKDTANDLCMALIMLVAVLPIIILFEYLRKMRINYFRLLGMYWARLRGDQYAGLYVYTRQGDRYRIKYSKQTESGNLIALDRSIYNDWNNVVRLGPQAHPREMQYISVY